VPARLPQDVRRITRRTLHRAYRGHHLFVGLALGPVPLAPCIGQELDVPRRVHRQNVGIAVSAGSVHLDPGSFRPAQKAFGALGLLRKFDDMAALQIPLRIMQQLVVMEHCLHGLKSPLTDHR
jgi:hypothetical protein